jgi:nicotinamide-nucleotide amidase
MTFHDPVHEVAQHLVELCTERELVLATAESCTGGMIAAAITDVAGSSTVFDRSFVTYSNSAKTQMLGVPEHLIALHGAVSEEVASAMAEDALAHSEADVVIAVTGIAGPGGGSAEKPVGLVWFACASTFTPTFVTAQEFGDVGRDGVRMQSVMVALQILLATIAEMPEDAEDQPPRVN